MQSHLHSSHHLGGASCCCNLRCGRRIESTSKSVLHSPSAVSNADHACRLVLSQQFAVNCCSATAHGAIACRAFSELGSFICVVARVRNLGRATDTQLCSAQCEHMPSKKPSLKQKGAQCCGAVINRCGIDKGPTRRLGTSRRHKGT